MLIPRKQYLMQLISKMNNNRIKVITGIRRAGKSYLLFKLFKNYLLDSSIKESQIIEISLDDINNIRYRNPFNLFKYLEKIKNDKKYYIFIDEIQFSTTEKNPYTSNDKDNITFIDVLLYLIKKENVDIYITGSNSKMLSSEILTQFRDRADEIYVTPLSFKELNEYYKDPNITWKNYIVSGGMPRLIELESFEEKSKYLKTLIEETYLKDIIERKELKSKDEILSALLNFISSSIGSLTNSLKLEKRFRSEKKISISHSTINNYLSYFEEAYLIKKSKRYDIKGNKYFSTITKYYFTDIGLRNAMLNFRQIEENHIMENIIYNELIRKGFNVDIGVIEHNASEDNKKIRKQLEIDFVINKENKKYYIQSAFSIPNKDKLIQEIKPLTKINDSFQKIIILKEDIVPRYDEFGIYYIGIKDFLLLEDLFF